MTLDDDLVRQVCCLSYTVTPLPSNLLQTSFASMCEACSLVLILHQFVIITLNLGRKYTGHWATECLTPNLTFYPVDELWQIDPKILADVLWNVCLVSQETHNLVEWSFLNKVISVMVILIIKKWFNVTWALVKTYYTGSF